MNGFVSGALVVSGANVTTLGNSVSDEVVTNVNIGTQSEAFSSMKFEVPRTKIRKGDYLQVKVEGWGRMSSSASGDKGRLYIGHDPSGRATTDIAEDDFIWTTSIAPTDLKVLIPLKIDT